MQNSAYPISIDKPSYMDYPSLYFYKKILTPSPFYDFSKVPTLL